jgi:hypothetical protein
VEVNDIRLKAFDDLPQDGEIRQSDGLSGNR